MNVCVSRLLLMDLFILVNMLIITNCENVSKEDCGKDECYKKILYNNGKVLNKCVKNENINDNKIMSLYSEDSFIIFDCIINIEEGYCHYDLKKNTPISDTLDILNSDSSNFSDSTGFPDSSNTLIVLDSSLDSIKEGSP